MKVMHHINGDPTDNAPENIRLVDMPSIAGKMRGLADRLDDASERCAARATQRDKEGRSELAMDLLARASTYQECAGLIREALK